MIAHATVWDWYTLYIKLLSLWRSQVREAFLATVIMSLEEGKFYDIALYRRAIAQNEYHNTSSCMVI